MIGDLPEIDAAPPENMLFICKLNPVTTEEDLEIIFSRFGTLTSCDIIRDWKTGDSLNYGFIGFDTKEACEEAYFKMNNVLIDDRRIRVDFSQSVHHLWKQFKKFGTRGDAGLRQEADTHQRGRQELQLKEHLGGGAGPSGRGGYNLVLDDEGMEEPQPRREYQQRGSRDGGRGRDRSRDRARPRDRDRGGRDKEKDRDRRDRSRDRGRDRKEERRRRSRSRSRSRERRKDRDDRGRR